MNNFFLLFILIFSLNLQARNLCDKADTTIGFFNGVWNSPEDAKRSRDKLSWYIRNGSNAHPRVEIDHTKLNYETFYNYSFKDTGDDWLNLLEVFEQILNEQGTSLKDKGLNRFELFFDFIHSSGPFLTEIINTVPVLKLVLITDKVQKKTNEYLSEQIKRQLDKLPTEDDYKRHQKQLNKITDLTLKANKLMFVAHSQGNLFVNKAYEYVKSKKGYENKEAVKVVHIAPASTQLKGEHVLIDFDIVINALRIPFSGKIASVTDNIYEQLQQSIKQAVLSLNLVEYFYRLFSLYLSNNDKYIQARKEFNQITNDPTGHEFIGTYLNPKFKVLDNILTKINNAIKILEDPDIKEEEKVKKGFFTAMLTWDGYGDVDLSVAEPDNFLVDAWNKKGNSGELDIDNRIGFGPEYYHASCDSEKLKTGIYKIIVTNYGGFPECKPDEENCKFPPPFRNASLYIETNDYGEMTTKNIILGNNKQLNRGYYVVDLEVLKSPFTNRYYVRVFNNNPRLIIEWYTKNK